MITDTTAQKVYIYITLLKIIIKESFAILRWVVLNSMLYLYIDL